MVSHKNLLEEGSRPVEGSSSRTSLGQPIRAKAKLTCNEERSLSYKSSEGFVLN